MGSSPLSGDVQEALIGVVIAVLAAIPVHLVLRRQNLRWTWALFPAAAGFAPLSVGIVESWSVALLLGGILTARWSFLLERRARETGGDARRLARQAVGIRDALAKRRARELIDQGRFHEGEEFVLGVNPRGKPIRLHFGGVSGRHGLMLGAWAPASRTPCCGPCSATSTRASVWWCSI
jgi:hypothetical protein